jgi:hypothetical protein
LEFTFFQNSSMNIIKQTKDHSMANTPDKNFRIQTGIGKNSDNDVNSLTLDVEDGLANNPAFPNLPVKLTDLETQRLAYAGTMTDARKGGTDRTRLKKAAKLALVDMLVKLALYCMGEAHHDLDALLSTGFEVVSTNRSSGPLDKPGMLDVLNDVSGQLTVRGQGVLNGRMYKPRTSIDGGKTWTEWAPFNGARRMVLQPTLPGATYMTEICALGGSTGQSPWSNPVSIMAT